MTQEIPTSEKHARMCMLCEKHTDALLVPVRCQYLQYVLHNHDCDILMPTDTLRTICVHVICDTCWFGCFKHENHGKHILTTKLSRACPGCISMQWVDITQKLLTKSSL
jgi:hypothetical protein